MDPTLTTGIPWLDRTLAILAAVGAICSLLSHVVSPDSKIGKVISWAALNFGKKLSTPKNGTVTELPPPRGFSRLAVLIALAVLTFAAAARADANPNALPDAIAKDPAAVQPAEDPPPPAPKFGGCTKSGKLCFGPSASFTIGAINLSTHKVEAAFSPGLGYGFTYLPGQWNSVGADAHFTLDPGAQQASAALMAKFFNGFFRIGVSRGFVGDRSTRLLFASGVDL